MAYTHSWKSIATLVINQSRLPFSHELLERTKDIVRSVYNYLLEQKISKGRYDGFLKQDYYDNLIKVDKFDQNCIGLSAYCDIWRTEHRIPKSMGTYFKGSPFSYVGTGTNGFIHSTINDISQSYLPYVGNNVKYDYVNGYIYVWDNKKPYKFVKVTDIFSDPNEVLSLCNGGSDCFADDILIPIDETLLPTVIEQARQNVISINKETEIGTDNLNNPTDEDRQA